MLKHALLLALLLAPLSARADEAADLLKKYDASMSPESFEMVSEMTAHRDDGSARTYTMKVLKSGLDRSRIWFDAPASAKGQEMLRQGDNLWIYMPNLKRAIRIASRDSFQGGDFNNADVLRANYSADYTSVLTEKKDGLAHLTLKAKTPEVAYDRVELWLRPDGLPVKAEFYASSGKLTRSAEFKDFQDYEGLTRPSLITMRNELATKRFSEMHTSRFAVKKDVPTLKFVLDDLGSEMTAAPLALALALAAGEVKVNGYLDSRSEYTHVAVDRPLPSDDVPNLHELLEGNLQLKVSWSERGFTYADLSLFFQTGGLFYGSDGTGNPIRLPDHDVPSQRNATSLNELYLSQAIGEHLSLTAGRKRVVWGSGLANNPTDLINPAKDPTDPSLQRAGAWMLQVQAPFERFTLTALASPQVLYTYNGIPSRWLDYPVYAPYETMDEKRLTGQNRLYPDPRDDQQHALVALRAYALVKDADLNAMYFWSNLYGDAFTSKSRFGASFSRYFFTDYELHAEALVQQGTSRLYGCGISRAGTLLPCASNHLPAELRELDSSTIYPRILAGTRYLFTDESTISVEYLYEGDGYNEADFRDYTRLLIHGRPLLAARAATLSQGGGGGGIPARFAFDPLRRHYAFLSYSKPKIRDDWTVGAVVVANLEDTSGLISPSVVWSTTEWLQLGLYGFVPFYGFKKFSVNVDGDSYSEYGLQPSLYRVQFEARVFY